MEETIVGMASTDEGSSIGNQRPADEAISSTGSKLVPPTGYEGTPPELWPDKDGNPPTITPKLIRQLRGRYFTVRYPRLTNCGHKFDSINEPANNCENCWFTFFNTHPKLVEVADQMYRTHGKNAVVALRGGRFVKNFGRYMVTIHHMMIEEGRLKVESSKE